MFDLDVLFVNPAITLYRPASANVGNVFTPKTVVCKSFNTGILSMASFLDANQKQIKVIDLLDEPTLKPLKKFLELEKPHIVAIGCCSGFGYPSAVKCAELVKEISPKTIVVGGGTHLGALGEVAFEDTNSFDFIEKSEGELVLLELLDRLKAKKNISDLPGLVYKRNGHVFKNKISQKPIGFDELPTFRFDLYPKYKKFAPFIEESRGCNNKCGFCVTGALFNCRVRIKKPERFKRDFESLFSFFGSEPTYAVLAPTFGLNQKYVKKFISTIKKFGVAWTTEIRVDAPWEHYLKAAVNSGLSVLNASPESASPEILLRMMKTSNPQRYLSKTKKLIIDSSKLTDLILKLNFVFYIGENKHTVSETISFLFESAKYIRSVAFSPLMIYPGADISKNFKHYAKRYGASLVSTSFWQSLRIYPCNISKYFSFTEMAALSNVLDKLFNSEEDYYKTMEYKFGTREKKQIKGAIIKAKFRSND